MKVVHVYEPQRNHTPRKPPTRRTHDDITPHLILAVAGVLAILTFLEVV